MRRVQSVDLTAVHMLEQIEGMLAERGAFLIFSRLPENVPSGQDMRQYFDQVGLATSERRIQTFSELDEALEWVEERIIKAAHPERMREEALELREIDVFLGRSESTFAALEACLDQRSYKAGEKIFAQGDPGDEMFLIRRGAVRIVLPLSEKQGRHLATFGRGDFFGEMAFLDPAPRSAGALAFTDTDLYVLSRKRFDTLAEEHRKLAMGLVLSFARVLSSRLRYANAELRALHLS
jgi:SulP family sulfate permease